MHRLVPDFILREFEDQQTHGTFPGAALFVDVSGFTALTEALLQHGTADAELLAASITRIFTPLQETIHTYGGFIANFAGDAFVAVFRQETGAPVSALQAASRIQVLMTGSGGIETPFGSFELRVRLGMASGEIEWGILRGERQSVYYFRGEAIKESMHAENLAAPGEWIISPRFLEQVKAWVDVCPAGDYWAVTGLRPAAQRNLPPPSRAAVTGPFVSTETLSAFFPPDLVTTSRRGEFRHVVSVFLNIQGVPEHDQLQALIGRFLTYLNQYGGYLCRLDFGENGCRLLLFWGALRSTEKDLERALKFVLLAKIASPIPVRAGISYGMAYAGFVGAGQREEYTCYSSRVNLAARLMSGADWGEICLGPECARRSRQAFNVRPVGARTFKGFAEPHQVFQLLSARARTHPFFPDQMHGREDELQRLRELIRPVFEGRFAGVGYVYGEAGQGKSRLFYELSCQLGDAVTWLEAQTDELVRAPFNPFLQMLKRYFGQNDNDLLAARQAVFDERYQSLLQQLRGAGITDPTAELVRTRSVLATFVGLPEVGSLWERLDAKGRYENTLYAIKALFLAESRLRPLVIFIDDGHWLDDDSRNLLAALTRGADSYPFVVLSALRYADDGTRPGWGLTGALTFQVDLDALDADTVREIAEAQLGGPVSGSLLGWLLEKTGGNPFFIEQMLLDARERHILTTAGGEWDFFPGQSVVIPQDVNAILIARIDRLNADVQEVVKTAAILGREFEVDVLSRMLELGSTPAHVTDLVNDAERQGIWVSTLQELLYLFRHALLRNAAYEMQLVTRRRALHALALHIIETVYALSLPQHYAKLVFHAEFAGDPAMRKKYLVLAADQAAAEYKNAAALMYYRQLLTLLTADREVIETRLKLGGVLEFMGDWQEAEDEYSSALALAGQTGDRAAVARSQEALGNLFQKQGDFVAALEWLEQALTGFRLLGDRRSEAETLGALGSVNGRKGEFDVSLRCLEECILISRELDDRKGVANVLHNMGNVAWSRGEYPAAKSLYGESLSLRQELGEKWAVATSLNNLGSLALNQGDYETAKTLYEESLSIRQEQGDLPGVASVRDNLGIVSWNRGDFSSAQKLHEDALVYRREIGDRPGMATTLCNLGNVFWQQGDNAAARTCFEESLSLRREMGNKRGIAMALNSLALSLAIGGQTRPGTEACLEGLHLNFEIGNRLGCAYSLLALGHIIHLSQPAFAVCLEAAGTRAFAELGAEIQKYYCDLQSETLDFARRVLDEQAFEVAWAEGHSLSREDAVHWAFEHLQVAG